MNRIFLDKPKHGWAANSILPEYIYDFTGLENHYMLRYLFFNKEFGKYYA